MMLYGKVEPDETQDHSIIDQRNHAFAGIVINNYPGLALYYWNAVAGGRRDVDNPLVPLQKKSPAR